MSNIFYKIADKVSVEMAECAGQENIQGLSCKVCHSEAHGVFFGVVACLPCKVRKTN